MATDDDDDHDDDHENEDKDEDENGDVRFFTDRYDKYIVAIARASRSSLLFSARKHETTAARS